MPNTQDEKQIQALGQRILAKCAERLGGTTALARHLQLPEQLVAEWIVGKSVPPAEVVLKAIEPLVPPKQ